MTLNLNEVVQFNFLHSPRGLSSLTHLNSILHALLKELKVIYTQKIFQSQNKKDLNSNTGDILSRAYICNCSHYM